MSEEFCKHCGGDEGEHYNHCDRNKQPTPPTISVSAQTNFQNYKQLTKERDDLKAEVERLKQNI